MWDWFALVWFLLGGCGRRTWAQSSRVSSSWFNAVRLRATPPFQRSAALLSLQVCCFLFSMWSFLLVSRNSRHNFLLFKCCFQATITERTHLDGFDCTIRKKNAKHQGAWAATGALWSALDWAAFPPAWRLAWCPLWTRLSWCFLPCRRSCWWRPAGAPCRCTSSAWTRCGRRRWTGRWPPVRQHRNKINRTATTEKSQVMK